MWTAGQIVSLLKDYMGETSVEKRREYLSRAYLKMMNNDVDQLIYFNTADIDSPFPLLNIQEGEKFYSVDDNLLNSDGTVHSPEIWNVGVEVRKISRVFTPFRYKGSGYGYLREFPEYYPFGEIAYLSRQHDAVRYYEIPISASPRLGSNMASITFFDDPTNYVGEDGQVYVEFWYSAPKLTSNGSPILLDTDKWIDALINGAVGYYEDVVNGQSVRLRKFLEEDIPEFTVERTESQRLKISQRFPTRLAG